MNESIDERKAKATIQIEATQQLCKDIAPIINGTVLPINPSYKDYHYPIACKIQLNAPIKGVNPVICIHVMENKPTHVRIYGEYPTSQPLGLSFTPDISDVPRSITSSRMKPVIRIADAIRKRFLPEYLQQFDNCVTRMLAAESNHYKSIEEVELLLSKIGIQSTTSLGRYMFFDALPNGERITFTCKGGSIRIDVECKVDTAVKICQLYKQHSEQVINQAAEKKDASNG